ncbi:MAG: aminotransferase class III-fold pyridoxal phosphate-dependent enzyme [Gemmatimonadaceae bacterium]
MTRYPETNVFFRKLRWEYPRITHAQGTWLYDDAGAAYLDACGGAFVSNLGHGVAEIADAMAAQGKKLAYVSGMTLTHPAVEDFATELAALAPIGLDRVYPLSSGSDAVEAALKLARQYWTELGEPAKQRIVALYPAYHGNTLLALSASAREHYKTLYKGWLVDVIRVPAYDADALERVIAADHASIAAFIMEPVGGSSTGALEPSAGYLRRVRDLCTRHKVLFIADEILVGAGRTGTWSALEPDGVVPDLQILGKGIAAGFAPLAAVLAPTRIVDVLAESSGGLNHAQTFSHHAVSCAAGTATIRYIRKHKLVERCARMGEQLHARLAELRELPHVGAIRGRGLLAGIELVDDASTNAPFPRAAHLAETLTRAALDNHLVVWPNIGHVNGTDGDLILLAPPYTVSDDELDQIVQRLSSAIQATVRQLAVRT